jgi:glycosyltransferase involved in cell wall biosynthesis
VDERRGGEGERIAVVLPCYKSKDHVLGVIAGIGPEAFLIVAVDDACPLGTGRHIRENCSDPRVVVIDNAANLGVGGATMNGYRVALERGADIVVKMDSDGQMDPGLLPDIVHPVIAGLADYAKGNRFFDVDGLKSMPRVRLFGNAGLSFLTKFATGYWNLFDPTNGYTAIHRVALESLPLERIDERYFFESDLLFRLYLAGAVVIDVPMAARYGAEESNLQVRRVVFPFLFKNLRNFGKRVFYRYFLRDLNFGSVELVIGTLLLLFGAIFGLVKWIDSASSGIPATAGQAMLSGLPILVGVQMILGFFSFDFQAVPRVPLQVILGRARRAVSRRFGAGAR